MKDSDKQDLISALWLLLLVLGFLFAYVWSK